ncbi:anaerobic ribonucleoside-triphosphate reductase activating protein [Dysgonomonas sp. BGC7]|uniref:anaerobic ribonucleoside-triphosphate reductase activating protein n=1 Tax=Dysgonomonas sp. BGC7 TaxID=1658008 RepID=UPI000682B92D|nr:anaerobic ribonucleoside-triphosphate reductase activating protein [Dysgonomonas sp. BGC7]MBD8387629.1 anaerobic ribonucleoside-triphosphate reductase activating protein [Dysgonomonas sp. BGC7]
MDKLSILNIVHDTSVDGPGFRTAIYAAGCTHQCPGCHNPQSWDKDNGSLFSVDELFDKIEEDEFANVTFTGGDPLMQVEGFTKLAIRIKQESQKTIWCYTGYSYEQILRSQRLSQILPFIDVLVDGRYISSLRNEDLQFRGSSNQRIIDINKSLINGNVIIWNGNHVLQNIPSLIEL